MCKLAVIVSLALAPVVAAGQQEADRLHNLKVVSNNVPDTTSVEALLKDIIKPGMTDEAKCMAVWQVVYENRFWNPSSRGNLRAQLGGTDPIVVLNCFAPTICQQDAEMCIALWGMLGYSARMWQLGWHTTSEVFYGGQWRHFDATLGRITRDDSGRVASVTLGRKRKGWKNWMRRESYVSGTEGISLGHTMGITLRRDETFTRYWYPLGKDPDYWCATSDGLRPDNRPRRGRRRLQRAMDLKERRFKPMPDDAAYGNGRWIFQPDFTRPNWRQFLEDSQNVAVSAGRDMYAYCPVRLHPEKPRRQAWVVFRVKSPYVLSGGWLSGFFAAGGKGDELEVLASTDHGRTWRSLWTRTSARANWQTIGLRDVVSGRFDCLIKVRMRAARGAQDVRVGGLRFESIVMNNPFVLPALKLGKTQVTVDTGPQLERISIHPCVADPEYRTQIAAEKNTTTSWEARGADWETGLLAKEPGRESYVVFKVTTPGRMRRVRWGGRFPDDNANNKLFYSFDGKSWTEKPWSYAQRVKDTQNRRREHVAIYEQLDSLPKGTTTVYLKYWFLRRGAPGGKWQRLLTPGIRIDADYLPASRGKRPPVEVTYCWNEYHGRAKVEKTHKKVIDSYPTTYGIIVKGDREPTMNWVRVRLKPDRPPVQWQLGS